MSYQNLFGYSFLLFTRTLYQTGLPRGFSFVASVYLTCSYEPSSLVLSEVNWDGLSRIHLGLWHLLRNDLQAAQLGGWGGWSSLVQRGREKERKGGVPVWRRHPKGNEGRSGVKTLTLAQLELEEDVPVAGWVRKGCKGWTWWTLLAYRDNEYSMCSCEPTLTLVPMPHTEMHASTDNPLQGDSYTPYTHNSLPVSTQKGEGWGTHFLQLSYSEKPKLWSGSKSLSPAWENLNSSHSLRHFQPCMNKEIF